MCSLKPGIKKGFLNIKEKFIISLAQKKKLPPCVVSMNLTNRTSSQVRNAYRRNITHKQNCFKGGWMPDEDKMLLCAVNTQAPNELIWSQVAKCVPGRNSEQCRHRFKLIEKKVQKNPNIVIEDFPRIIRKYQVKQPDLSDECDILENFKENRKLLKNCFKPIETVADRKLKKSFLDNIYVTKHCNFSSKCDLFKHILDYLGANLIVPQTFVHNDDIMDEGLMSMMTYLKECTNEVFTLGPPNTAEQNMTDDIKFIHEGVHGVLRTSDIINSDLDEVEGLFDIRIKHFDSEKSEGINQNSVVLKKPTLNLSPSYFMGSVPPNFETFKMLYTYTNNMSTTLKVDSLKDINKKFDWNNEQSKTLHQQLVAIFRWPALFSGLVNYNTSKINMIINTEQHTSETNFSEIQYFYSNKRKQNL